MDICVLNPFFYPYPGGTEKVLLEIYRRMAKRHNITVISAALKAGQKDSVEDIYGINVIRLKTSYIDVPILPMPFPVTMGLRDAISKQKADIYHINNRHVYFGDTVKCIKRSGGKMALTLHDAIPKNIDPFTDNGGYVYDMLWGRRLIEHSDVITGVSRDTIATTVPNNLIGKCNVIYNGVDFGKYRPRAKNSAFKIMKRLGISKDSFVVLNNGRLINQKGQIYLIRAIAELAKERGDIVLNIIGRGSLKDTFLYMARDLGISDRMRICSGIPENEMPYYYNMSSVFVSASLYEPASISIMEALASGIPVVATKVGGVPETMKGRGIYVKPRSINGIKRGIERFIDNQKEARRIGMKGRELMIKEHDWNLISKKYETVFESTVRK
jgi:glycosyltransferase involved in cell wall biosynthesis